MAVKGHLAKELDKLTEHQLREVAEYVAFLKFSSRFMAPLSVDESLPSCVLVTHGEGGLHYSLQISKIPLSFSYAQHPRSL